MKPLDLLLALLVMLIWGINFVVAKFGLAELPAVLLMAMRFGAVALFLVPFVKVPRGRLKRIALLSFSLGTVHYAFMFSGMARLDAGTTAILTQLQVPFSALIAAILYGEKLGWVRALGMAVAFAGVAIMMGEPRLTSDLVAVGFVIIATLVWALANIQIKELGPVGGFSLNAYLGLFAAPQLFITSLLLESDHRIKLAEADWTMVLFAVFYLAVVVQIVSYAIWYRLLRLYPVNQLMPITLLCPVLGVLAGVVLLGEVLTWPIIVGSAATLAGVAIIMLWRRPAPPAPAQSPTP
jgi:O-acetylserine/cysteine efflux transporter